MAGADFDVDLAVRRAADELDRGRPDLARATAEDALRREPTSVVARGVLGHALAELGELDRAETLLEPLVRVPEAAGLVLRVRSSIARKRVETVIGTDAAARRERQEHAIAAVGFAQEGVGAEPASAEARIELSAALRVAGSLDWAVVEAREAVRLAAGDDHVLARALFVLAASAVQLPTLRDEGLAAARRAVSLDPTNGSFLQALAGLELATGHRAQAISTAMRALRVAPVERFPVAVARYAQFLLLNRALGLGLLVAFCTPLLVIGGLSQVLVAELGSTAGYTLGTRIAGAVGLLAMAGTQALVFRPLLSDGAARRAVIRFGRKRFMFWVAVVALLGSLLAYATAIVTGFLGLVVLLVPVLLIAWYVHARSASSLPKL